MIFGGSSGLLVKSSDIFEKSSKTTLLVCVYIINNIVSSRVHRQVQHYKRISYLCEPMNHSQFSCLQKKIGVPGENLPKVALRLRSHLVPSVGGKHNTV